MSLILKGINNIPKDAIGVKLVFQCYSEDDGTIFGTMINSHTEERCVALDDIIQIPKGHGRLIDANELSKEVEIEIEEFLTESGIRSAIRNAPTILESEVMPK